MYFQLLCLQLRNLAKQKSSKFYTAYLFLAQYISHVKVVNMSENTLNIAAKENYRYNERCKITLQTRKFFTVVKNIIYSSQVQEQKCKMLLHDSRFGHQSTTFGYTSQFCYCWESMHSIKSRRQMYWPEQMLYCCTTKLFKQRYSLFLHIILFYIFFYNSELFISNLYTKKVMV